MSGSTPIKHQTSDPPRGIVPGSRAHGRSAAYQFALALIVVAFATALVRDIYEPWTGLHDWNGAFFSQLARNLLRYPVEIHHGMPLVAAGAGVPSPDERSVYATHPPGLVWLLAGAFGVFGEQEAVARSVPIACSLITLVILAGLWRKAHGKVHALAASLCYACMPMAVYFGRMVDHEAVSLMLMAAACAAWVRANRGDGTRGECSGIWAAACGLLLGLNCCIDWAGCLFAGVFFLGLFVWTIRRDGVRAARARAVATVCTIASAGAASMIFFLVYAGLEGRWNDLLSIFGSRSGAGVTAAPLRMLTQPGDAWRHTIANAGWPMLAAGALGAMASAASWLASVRGSRSGASAVLVPADWATRDATMERVWARRGLGMIAMTGALWLALFPRQYLFHAYWAFYLGPALAGLTATGVVYLARLSPVYRGVRVVVAVALLAVMAVAGLRGVGAYFAHDEPILRQHVRAWQAIAAEVKATERVVLFRDPTFVERRGRYVFRNIVPPQFAYYLDRAFSVEHDLEKVAALYGMHAVFVMPVADAVNFGAQLRPLRERFGERLVEDVLVVFDLRRPKPETRRR